MKTPVILLVFLMAAACMGCAAHTPAEKAALDRASDLNLSKADLSGRVREISDPCVILPYRSLEVVRIDGVAEKESRLPGTNIVFVEPGRRTLSIVVDTGMTTGGGMGVSSGRIAGGVGFSSKVLLPAADVAFTFEKGRHYRLDYRPGVSSADFVFTEITGADEQAHVRGYLREYASQIESEKFAAAATADKLKAYQEFSRQNPGLLEGRWATGEGKDELEFSGNKVRYVAPKSILFSTRPTLEGIFIFDRDTVITLWEKYYTPLGVVTRNERPDAFPKAVWAYTLSGGTLEIKNGGFTPLDIGGTYKRTK